MPSQWMMSIPKETFTRGIVFRVHWDTCEFNNCFESSGLLSWTNWKQWYKSQMLTLKFSKTFGLLKIYGTRNPALRASKRGRLVAMYIAVPIRPSSYVHRVISEVAVSFLPEVVAQIWLDPLRVFWGCRETFIKYFF